MGKEQPETTAEAPDGPPGEHGDTEADPAADVAGADVSDDSDEAAKPVVDEVSSHDGPDPAEELRQELADTRDKLLRARADYDNLQRRVERDAVLERERVKARVLEHFLQVFEYGKMAEAEADKTPGPLAEGVKMIVREFERLLESEGVEMIGSVGEPFDASIHEAVAEEEAKDVAPGHVSRVVKVGYRLGDRVLRFARVAVAPGDASGDGGGARRVDSGGDVSSGPDA